MVKLKVFAPYDSKLSTWMNPMFFSHYGQAERAWIDIVNTPDNLPNKYPGDFVLYEIGTYDIDSGILEPVHPPVQVMSGVNAKKAAPLDKIQQAR